MTSLVCLSKRGLVTFPAKTESVATLETTEMLLRKREEEETKALYYYLSLGGDITERIHSHAL